MEKMTLSAVSSVQDVALQVDTSKPMSAFIMQAECEYLKRAIMAAGGNKRRAAEAAGVPYATFARKVARHGLTVRPVAFEVVQDA